MGGVIGRYTLARMENESKTHDVRLFVAHDSPMQGANTPLAFQHFSIHMKQEYANTPLAWGVGEVLIPIYYGLGELGSSFLNAFGANTSVPAYVTPAQLLSLQDQTASRQLNYWSAFSLPNGNQEKTRSFNQSWQQTLTNMGWPTLSRNVAISNGNECAVDNGFPPGAPLLTIDSRSNPGFWLDMLNAALTPLVGLAIQDLGLVIVGSIPGRSRWQTNFDFNSYGFQGSQNQIYRGRIQYKKKFLWIGPTISYDITNKTYNAPQEALPFDTYSGGRFNFLEDDGDFTLDIPILSDLVQVQNDFYGFIPVVSALDIKRNNGEVLPADYLARYAGGTTPSPALTTEFNNFIVDFMPNAPINNEHISFQVRNGDWLANELEEVLPNLIGDCSFMCNSSSIVGPGLICSSATFSLGDATTTTTWSLAPSNSGSITVNSNTSITITKASGFIGNAVLTANISSPACGNAIVPKNLHFGRPTGTASVSGDTELDAGPFDSAVFTVNTTNVTSFSVVTWVVYSLSDPNANSYFQFQPQGNGSTVIIQADSSTPAGDYYIQARISNACGFLPADRMFHVNNDGPPVISMTEGTSSTIYRVYPNPSSDQVNIVLNTGVEQPSQEINVSGELFDVLGISKLTIPIYQNSASFSVAQLQTGIYILKIYMNEQVESHQILVE